jgi:hypothetical protein
VTHGHDERDEQDTPRWLRLAATLRAEPAPDTLARVRARLAAREPAPAWLGWLARPVTVAASAALLVASAWTGVSMLSTAASEVSEPVSLSEALLGDDGSLGFGSVTVDGATDADSQDVTP